MLKIGEKQVLRVDKQVPFGVYLSSDVPGERVLLPRSQVPEDAGIGDEFEVFLYKDSEDRLIATRKEPKLTLHQVGYLTVVQVTRVGAFLDWGLDKDLLLPYHEQPRERVAEGQAVLVAVYLDKSGRLCATTNVYPWLRTDSPYKAGDTVNGIVYAVRRNFGAFVAVDSIYSALIPRRKLDREYREGEAVTLRVIAVKPDGKLDLCALSPVEPQDKKEEEKEKIQEPVPAQGPEADTAREPADEGHDMASAEAVPEGAETEKSMPADVAPQDGQEHVEDIVPVNGLPEHYIVVGMPSLNERLEEYAAKGVPGNDIKVLYKEEYTRLSGNAKETEPVSAP